MGLRFLYETCGCIFDINAKNLPAVDVQATRKKILKTSSWKITSMKEWGIRASALVLLVSQHVLAADAAEVAAPQAASPEASSSSSGAPEGASSSSDKAKEALKQNADDATSEKNLDQVFKAAEKTYSLLKAGNVTLNYGLDYSFFRDSRIDIALSESSSEITRFRIEEDAQHTFSSDLSLDYGVWDNVTFNTNLPIVVKYDTEKDLKTAALGDVSFGVRWQPVPVKRGMVTSTLFGNLSTASGDSPYKINRSKDLSTGKGYYGLTGGVSFNKLYDPVVLFGSISYGMGIKASGLNQNQGDSRNLIAVVPGESISGSAGMAYSLNYDISVTASYQMSYAFPTKFQFTQVVDGETITPWVKSADQVSASLNFSVALRTSPKRIVNIGFGYGLTEDSPDVSVSLNIPIDIAGFTAEQ